MSRPARAWIDLDALRGNLDAARRIAGGARILAVVKANGYGHGAVATARALAPGCDALGVACTEEALELRESGIASPILLMEGIFSPDEIPILDRHRLSIVLHCERQLQWLLEAKLSAPIDCWLKLDTGMHRIGFERESLPRAFHSLRAAPQVSELVLMSHLARADEPDEPLTPRQIERFADWTRGLPGTRSLANSATLLAWPEAHADWVRPGIMLYGASPLGEAHDSAALLRPVMHLTSELIAIRDLAVGASVGYGGRFVCERPSRIGVVARGYCDDYPRHAPDGTPAAVAGRRVGIAGRVSMDMLTLDLTDCPEARVGDPVELWGARVAVNEVAEAAGTISYELLTGISPRVPRWS